MLTHLAHCLQLLRLCFLLLALLGIQSHALAVNHVIHISVDGLPSHLLEANMNANPTEHSNFWRFVNEGATTFNARTDYTDTETLPNHTSMVTGRPVAQPSGMPNTTHHGYTNNGFPLSSQTLHNTGNPNLSYIASTFDVAHDNGLSTALHASKTKFDIFEQSYTSITGAPDTTGPDNGRDKIDVYLGTDNPFLSHPQYLIDMAANEFNYSFVHFRLPDAIGHADGWGSVPWNDIVEFTDDNIGDIFNLVETDAGLVDDTIIILTSDHGGSGNGHTPATDPEHYTIPVFVWGPGVAAGADLYDLNPLSRTDPGTGRPDHSASGQPIRNGGTGNLALDLLGLGPVNGSIINSNQDLLVASLFDADFDADQSVDASDLDIWQSGFGIASGATQAVGDANGNGSVDGGDYLQWAREYGSNLVVVASASVPEPSSLLLMLLALASANLRTFR